MALAVRVGMLALDRGRVSCAADTFGGAAGSGHGASRGAGRDG